MSISSSARKPKGAAATGAGEGAVAPAITLSERSSTGLALLRILVGYLWFQQLFWKLPPTFAGLYGYVVRESQHAILPGYGALLQHTFLAGCSSLLVLLALFLVAVPAGRRLGVDYWLAPRLQSAGQRHRWARIASWFV